MNLSWNHSDRYARQVQFRPVGAEGQHRISCSRALVCGCGALGSFTAEILARAGVGHLRIVDRDFLEINNLQRQILYDEQDVTDHLPKAVAAAAKLSRINSSINIEPVVVDVSYQNILALLDGVEVIVDGTDNFETRFLLNDAAVSQGIPWIYGGCLGAAGQSMTIVPGKTACLTCLLKDVPPPGSMPTCDTAGVLGPIVGVIASLQAAEAIKILSGHREAIHRGLAVVELWNHQIRSIDLSRLPEKHSCITCQGGKFPWLEGTRGSQTAVLCGRNAVQLSHASLGKISLASLAKKLAGVGPLVYNRHLMRLEIDGYQLTLFPDGRAIIGGTDDVATARSLYAKYVGS